MVSKTATGNTKYVKSTAMVDGETYTGFYTGLIQSSKGYKPSISLQTEDGKRIVISASGNLSYFDKDTQDGRYILGQLTQITKTGMRKTNTGKVTGVFEVQQDADKVISVSQPIQAPASTSTSVEDRLATLRGSKKTA